MLPATRKSRFSAILLAALMLFLVTSACGFHGFLPGSVTNVVDISITEDMLQQGRPHFMVNNHEFCDSLLDDVTLLELHDGYLRFIGTRVLPDGRVVPGSVDLYFGAQDGRLTARIIAVDIPGIDMDDPLVAEINQEMKVEFSYAGYTSDADLLFKEVQVTDEELHMKVQVTVRF